MHHQRESAWVRVARMMLLIFNLAFAILALYFIYQGGVKTEASQGLEYKDFVSILLTGLSVMIAIGAAFIAVLAIWSYNHFRELSKESAERKTKDLFEEWRSKEAPLLVSQHVNLLYGASVNKEGEQTAADKMGEKA